MSEGLCQSARDHDALLLAAAERGEGTRLEVRRAGRRQRLARDRLIRGALELEGAQMWVAAHQHHVDHAEVERCLR